MEALSTTLDAVCLASEIILESGGETYRAEETAEKMCQGLGIPKVDVLALPTGLMLTLTLSDNNTFSRLVRVHRRSIDLGRIDQCNDISRKVADGRLSAGEALTQLKEIHRSRKDRRFLMVAAGAVTASSFTVMLGGSWFDFIISFFCGALVQLLLPPMDKMRIPPLVSSMAAGAITTLMALVGTLFIPEGSIEAIISGAIMPLLPGLAVTNAMRDTIRGDLVSGGARVMEAILSVMMLAAGIGLVLSIWGGIGV